jgi:hypothetical protein
LDLAPGRYDLTFTPPYFRGLAPVAIYDVLLDGNLVRNVTYPAGFSVSGTIRRPDSQGIAGVTIYCCCSPEGAGFGFAPSVLDPPGAFVGSLPVGSFDCQFQPPAFTGLGSLTARDVSGPPDRLSDIALPEGVTLFGRVTGASDEPVEGAFVLASPLEEERASDQLTGYGRFSDIRGRYALALVRDRYDLYVTFPPSVAPAAQRELAGQTTQAPLQRYVTRLDLARDTRLDMSLTSTTPRPTCVGDCDESGIVTVDELIGSVNIALGNAQPFECLVGDTNADGQITVDEILTAVNNALNGCSLPAAAWDPG